MEEFFHTFNALHNADKQVVITSDVPPKQLNGFEDRLRSRFEWGGLITDVQPPDLETRIAILRKKAASERLDVPPAEVLSYIGSRISTNIRELEGALIRVTAFANLNRQAVDLALAEIVLKDLITDDDTQEITPSMVIAQTAAYFGLTIDDLCGPRGPGCSSRPARSRCTCAASSRTCRCRRSASSSAGGTTPRSCTRTRRSRARWRSVAPPTTR